MTTNPADYLYDKKKQISVLSMNTLAFTINFAVWTMFSVIGIKIKGELGLSTYKHNKNRRIYLYRR